MRLLHAKFFFFKEFVGDDKPKYAIVSHRWSEEEVTYQEFLDAEQPFVNGNHTSYGWIKIAKACEIALQYQLEWIWIDTICIDKKSSAELTEAINSMFSWYSCSTQCFVFLPDVHSPHGCRCVFPEEESRRFIEDHEHDSLMSHPGYHVFSTTQLKASVWFTRAWTLQELLAPETATFFDSDYHILGDRDTLATLISEATRIPSKYLLCLSLNQEHFSEASVAERMKWASSRTATRKEDAAYSLLGLFDVNMPLLYGEGSRAFLRLQQEIIAKSDDETVFAWFGVGRGIMDELRGNIGTPLPVIADEVRKFSKGVLLQRRQYIPRHQYVMTNKGIRFDLPMSKKKLNYAFQKLGYANVLIPLNCEAVIQRRNQTSTRFPVGITVKIKPDAAASGAAQLGPLSVLRGERHGSLKIGSSVSAATSTYEAGISESYDTSIVEPSPIDPDLNMFHIHSLSWFSSYTDRRSSHDLVLGDFDGTEVSYPVYIRHEDAREAFQTAPKPLTRLASSRGIKPPPVIPYKEPFIVRRNSRKLDANRGAVSAKPNPDAEAEEDYGTVWVHDPVIKWHLKSPIDSEPGL